MGLKDVKITHAKIVAPIDRITFLSSGEAECELKHNRNLGRVEFTIHQGYAATFTKEAMTELIGYMTTMRDQLED